MHTLVLPVRKEDVYGVATRKYERFKSLLYQRKSKYGELVCVLVLS